MGPSGNKLGYWEFALEGDFWDSGPFLICFEDFMR